MKVALRRRAATVGLRFTQVALEQSVISRNRDSQLGRVLIQGPCWRGRPAWMTRPYSEDLRERALLMAGRGQTIRAIGAALAISPSCVSKWRKLERETGALKPGQIGGHKKRVLSGGTADWLRERIRSVPSPCAGWPTSWRSAGSRRIRRPCGSSCMPRASASKKTVVAAEQERPDLARQRARWKAHQGKLDATRLVFIDETWIKTNMAPLRGWGPRNRRLVQKTPHGHWATQTFIAAL